MPRSLRSASSLYPLSFQSIALGARILSSFHDPRHSGLRLSRLCGWHGNGLTKKVHRANPRRGLVRSPTLQVGKVRAPPYALHSRVRALWCHTQDDVATRLDVSKIEEGVAIISSAEELTPPYRYVWSRTSPHHEDTSHSTTARSTSIRRTAVARGEPTATSDCSDYRVWVYYLYASGHLAEATKYSFAASADLSRTHGGSAMHPHSVVKSGRLQPGGCWRQHSYT